VEKTGVRKPRQDLRKAEFKRENPLEGVHRGEPLLRVPQGTFTLEQKWKLVMNIDRWL